MAQIPRASVRRAADVLLADPAECRVLRCVAAGNATENRKAGYVFINGVGRSAAPLNSLREKRLVHKRRLRLTAAGILKARASGIPVVTS